MTKMCGAEQVAGSRARGAAVATMVAGLSVFMASSFASDPMGTPSETTTSATSTQSADADKSATTQPGVSPRDQMVRKLLDGESTAVDQVDLMLASMGEASERLNSKSDAGSQTQAAQRRALEGLDTLIRQAGENRRAAPQASRVRPRGEREGQRRRPPGERKQMNQGKGGQAQRGGPGAEGGAGADSSRKQAAKAELARGWGFLPGRERDEVLQGFDEEFLAKYREQIMDYYRRLADAAVAKASSSDKR
ncbi:hypothetical protein RAS2_14170 [Phycisphaerae bacterium RAS2]|nr:hypothetical protein RAS2_14170 [Phycisphaerae bacterium RAS2]